MRRPTIWSGRFAGAGALGAMAGWRACAAARAAERIGSGGCGGGS